MSSCSQDSIVHPLSVNHIRFTQLEGNLPYPHQLRKSLEIENMVPIYIIVAKTGAFVTCHLSYHSQPITMIGLTQLVGFDPCVHTQTCDIVHAMQPHSGDFPRYPAPWPVILPVLQAAILRQRRSFRLAAQACVSRLKPPLEVVGRENIPSGGPCLLTLNHYARPGFHAWWLTLAVSAVVAADIHWITTAALTYPDLLRARLFTPVTRWALQRVADTYTFTPMPPMPPNPAEAEARAAAVRGVLEYARSTQRPLVGLAPEGMDARLPGPAPVQAPPAGVGRFITLLAGLGLQIIPVGVYEAAGRLRLRFGPGYRLELPAQADLDAQQRDRFASRTVMEHIAAQLPAELRGEFA
jgi:hypothetical protein